MSRQIVMERAASARLPARFAEQREAFSYGDAPLLIYWEATQKPNLPASTAGRRRLRSAIRTN